MRQAARRPFCLLKQVLTLLDRDGVWTQVDITINLDYFYAFKALPEVRHQGKEALGISTANEWSYVLIHFAHID